MIDYPRRGEIYRVKLDPTIGSEMSKTRPCLIISNNSGNRFSSRVIVAPITSKGMGKIYKMEVFVDENEGGMIEPSKVALDQIRSIDKQRLENFVGRLSSERMKEVDKAIKITLSV